jgi:hypothetical protein
MNHDLHQSKAQRPDLLPNNLQPGVARNTRSITVIVSPNRLHAIHFSHSNRTQNIDNL